jgi:uncharacterized membrane protein YsdA (DUF1294 family)
VFETAAAYLLAINLAAYLAFAADKRRAATRAWRIPERTLLWLAALGGSSGAIAAQQILRHKTRKEPFRTLLWMVAGAQAAGLLAIFVLCRPR